MTRLHPRVVGAALKRHRRSVVFVGLTGVIVFVAATARLFVWPPVDSIGHVDAVVLFAGGRGERLALAERLMEAGVATELVIPNGLAVKWPQGNRACTESRPYNVHCPRPDPDTTIGEARVIAELAGDESWDSVLVVTSSYQLSRAALLLDRCFDGEVLTARAQPNLEWLEWGSRVSHEWLAWSRAVVQRSC